MDGFEETSEIVGRIKSYVTIGGRPLCLVNHNLVQVNRVSPNCLRSVRHIVA